jgi:2-methylaconitate cis-trans-isomerase PrpF
MNFTTLPATLMRGGTSKGLFFRADQLPDNPAQVQALLVRALGSPDPYGSQLDGLGTGISSTSKIVIIGPSQQPGCHVDYLFGHVAIADGLVDWSGNCGNLSAAVPVFALMQHMVAGAPANGPVAVHIWQANIGKKIIAELHMQDGLPVWWGDYHLDGIAFPAAAIRVRFLDPAGGASGKLFPTGRPHDTLTLPDGSTLEATLIDAGNPTVFVRAADLGLRGDETGHALSAEQQQKLEWARCAGAVMMKLGPDADTIHRERPATPKISFLSPASQPGCALTARIVSMGRLHHAYTGTGAIALAAAAAIKHTLAAELCGAPVRGQPFTFAHASGSQTLEAIMQRHGRSWKVEEVAMTRHARPLMQGTLYIPRQP